MFITSHIGDAKTRSPRKPPQSPARNQLPVTAMRPGPRVLSETEQEQEEKEAEVDEADEPEEPATNTGKNVHGYNRT